MALKRLPAGPPPPLATPYKCTKCEEITWIMPFEKKEKVRCLWCGVGPENLVKESIIDHIFPV